MYSYVCMHVCIVRWGACLLVKPNNATDRGEPNNSGGGGGGGECEGDGDVGSLTGTPVTVRIVTITIIIIKRLGLFTAETEFHKY
uniref:Putative secreted protein n=1 Tax=Anopheles darlingi TaxID=43151 RepID=A0A2M4DKI9_ANODA